ncbi:hypothetical protein A3E15_02195 [Candidatus Woesebacteria bacterium RIFCSPHIGHO2_12_FULL_42_9]|uniref:Activator of Hsp90 ATPase homologue 1/2-like C-terminal domain-containing protein n=3 Tax=Candidatus Woeseibacteriota TaxID=1752722 RepID=A0A1F8AXT1_9BACT|nr:MAG: Activator of Hsp90 ATPase 1 family protein [Candidatus Woesebacteria bacterium GW2011_GWA1_39_12]OGM06273.1 MAG: hypothetical protein A2129_02250 [Candidatus Woesebacteria bacterium GWC1_42_13]OGM56536.1 MAG: hypothetical protein A3E15_02195 [Candidatus Woesebacteria bacterium RIFCSPHIGHO2_12_FULL_42_9]
MRSFKQKYVIKASIGKVWQALVDPEQIEKWGGGPAKMSASPGDNFSLWGGDIWGKNSKVIPNKLLIQDWYGGKWETPSKVSFELKEINGNTELTLIHKNLPQEGWKELYDGWKDYYLGPLKTLVEK